MRSNRVVRVLLRLCIAGGVAFFPTGGLTMLCPWLLEVSNASSLGVVYFVCYWLVLWRLPFFLRRSVKC